MSTGYLQPEGIVGVQIHELLGIQSVYSPFNVFQINIGYGVVRNFVVGGKLKLYEGEQFIRSLSLNADAAFEIREGKFQYFNVFPNINSTFGGKTVQFSISLTSQEVEKMKHIIRPIDIQNMDIEDDGFRRDKLFYLFPAVIQTGIMFHVPSNRIKFITEVLFEYEGKSDLHILKLFSFGARKYWTSMYFDIAIAQISKYYRPNYSENFTLPYFSFGFFL